MYAHLSSILSNAKKRYFLALNLLRIDSSLDIRAECHRKKCAIFIFFIYFCLKKYRQNWNTTLLAKIFERQVQMLEWQG